MSKCDALEWKRTPEGMDYVECSADDALPVMLHGKLLALPAVLCLAHRKVFDKMHVAVCAPEKKPKLGRFGNLVSDYTLVNGYDSGL